MAHDVRSATGRKRRWVFIAWIAASIIVAIYLFATAPFAEYFHEAHWVVAVAVPALMFFFLLTGLGWLIYLTTAKRRDGGPRDR